MQNCFIELILNRIDVSFVNDEFIVKAIIVSRWPMAVKVLVDVKRKNK